MRRVMAILGAAAVAASLTLAGPMAAEAQPARPAGGVTTSPVGTFEYSFGGVTYDVPVGCFLVDNVSGSGLKLESTSAGVTCVGPAATIPLFCNYRGVYRFYDANAKLYATETKALHSGCGIAQYDIPSANKRTMKTGNLCLEFLVNGKKRATTCIAVFK